jgi:TPR repeat protein
MLVAMAGAVGAFDGTSTPSGDFPLEDARKAYQLGDYAAACRLLNMARGYNVPQDCTEAARQLSLVFGSRGPGSSDGGDKAKAFTALQYAADHGHLAALWKLARMYAAGDGVPHDDLRAFNYFSQIANAHPDEMPGTAQAHIVANAFVALGRYYLSGIPNSAIVQDTTRAREMFAYAASYFGDADAQYQLGRLYLDGTPSDPHQAVRWFQLAASKGDCRAEAILGDMLFQGKQVPRQAARGLMWLTLSKDCAGPEENWVKPLYDNAFHRASDDERAMALVLLEDWLKGRRE